MCPMLLWPYKESNNQFPELTGIEGEQGLHGIFYFIITVS